MAHFEAPLNYLREPPSEKPALYIHQRPPENARLGPQLGPRERTIHDVRELPGDVRLEVEGVALVRHETAFSRFLEPEAVRADYYPQVEALVAAHTGAQRVVAFDHNVRSAALVDSGESLAQMPVRFAHNDYTDLSGPQRVRDLLPDQADTLLRGRVAVVNVWRPTRGPVEATPLAVCDAQTMRDGDLVEMDLIYPDRMGEIQALQFRPEHRWLYVSRMEREEVLLLKCFDSAHDGRARFTAHSAVDDPATPEDAAPRESIEVRTLAFFPAEPADPVRQAR